MIMNPVIYIGRLDFWQAFPGRTNPAKSFIIDRQTVVVFDSADWGGSANRVMFWGINARLKLR